MRKLILAFSIFVLGTTTIQAQESLYFYGQFINKAKAWTASLPFLNINDFEYIKTIPFEETDIRDINDITQFINTYKPLMYFSGGKTAFVDMYSYGISKPAYNTQTDSSALYLCDFSNNSWSKILQVPHQISLEDMVWIDGQHFIILATLHNNKRVYRPIVFIADITVKQFKVFVDKNKDCHRSYPFYSKKGKEALKWLQ